MTTSNPTSGKITFSVDSSLLFQLGEQLVAKSSVALAELVKNAYDADATEVTVILENVGRPGGTILIEDNGHGMLFEDVESSWMRIATPEKQQISTSRVFGRPLTGAKGIGRFAVRRLGEKLILQTVAERLDGIKEAVTAEFDWRAFQPGVNIDQIPVDYKRQTVDKQTKTGVLLLIEGARDSWTEDEIIGLRRDLLSLQTPFPDLIDDTRFPTDSPLPTDPGFNLVLDIERSGDVDRFSGGLAESFLDAAWAELNGFIDSEGVAHYSIKTPGTDILDEIDDDMESYEDLPNVRFKIFYFIYQSEYFRESAFGVRDAQRKGREEGGVRVYLDGFRVTSYGTTGDDWLQFDEYAVRNVDMASNVPISPEWAKITTYERPYLLIPRNRNLFGAVSISQKQHGKDESTEGIQIAADRERLIETPAFEQLKRFVQRGVYWMTLKYAAWRAEQETAQPPSEKSVPDMLDIAAQEIDEIADELESREAEQPEVDEQEVRGRPEVLDGMGVRPSPPTQPDAPITSPPAQGHQPTQVVVSRLRQTSKQLQQVKKQSEDDRQRQISELSMLRLLASAGTTLMVMEHQLRALVSNVSYIGEDLQEIRAHIPPAIIPQYDEIREQVDDWHQLVESQVAPLGFLLSPDARQNPDRHILRAVAEETKNFMRYYMRKNDIYFENEIPEDIRTPSMFEAELYAVFLNILSNALKAVRGQADRRIRVNASREERFLRFRMMNTGKRLPQERWEISFRPFVTDSTPDSLLGLGTGMGLKVVYDIVTQYHGNVRFVDPTEPWQTCIQIEIPY